MDVLDESSQAYKRNMQRYRVDNGFPIRVALAETTLL